MRRFEVLRGVDNSFGGGGGVGGETGGGGGGEGPSFVSLEDVIDFVAEVKTQMNPSECPSSDLLPIPDADWGSDEVVDPTNLENILQVGV